MRKTWKGRLAAAALSLSLSLSLAVPALAEDTAPLTREESAAQAAGYAMQYGGALSASWALAISSMSAAQASCSRASRARKISSLVWK